MSEFDQIDRKCVAFGQRMMARKPEGASADQ